MVGCRRRASATSSSSTTGDTPPRTSSSGHATRSKSSHSGDNVGAVAAQKQLFKLEPIVRTGNAARMGPHACVLGSYKTALMLRGVIETNAMGRPLTRFDAEDTERVRAILEQAGLL